MITVEDINGENHGDFERKGRAADFVFCFFFSLTGLDKREGQALSAEEVTTLK